MVRPGSTAVAVAMAMAVVVSTCVMWARADTVQGTATVGTTKVTLTSGMAVGYISPSGPRISVLLSDKPADGKAFEADTRTGPGEPLVSGVFEGAWKGQHFDRKFSGFTFTIDADSNLRTDEFLVGGSDNTFSLGDHEYVVEVKSTSPRLVGRIRTRTPIVDAGSIQAGLDASFDLSVISRP